MDTQTIIQQAKEMEMKIADNYAIQFSKWCVYYRDKNRNFYSDTYTTKELLEIFKKELLENF